MIITVVSSLFRLYYLLIFVRIIISWFPVNQYSQWYRSLQKLTDPYLDLFRRIIPPIGMVDISPIAAFFALNLIERIVLTALIAAGIG